MRDTLKFARACMIWGRIGVVPVARVCGLVEYQIVAGSKSVVFDADTPFSVTRRGDLSAESTETS